MQRRKEAIVERLKRGVSHRQIALELDCSPSVVTYHAHKLALTHHRTPPHYDWSAIRAEQDAGASGIDLALRYGFSREAWNRAVKRGKVKADRIPRRVFDAEEARRMGRTLPERATSYQVHLVAPDGATTIHPFAASAEARAFARTAAAGGTIHTIIVLRVQTVESHPEQK